MPAPKDPKTRLRAVEFARLLETPTRQIAKDLAIAVLSPAPRNGVVTRPGRSRRECLIPLSPLPTCANSHECEDLRPWPGSTHAT